MTQTRRSFLVAILVAATAPVFISWMHPRAPSSRVLFNAIYVDCLNGSDWGMKRGGSWSRAFLTLKAATPYLRSGDTLFVSGDRMPNSHTVSAITARRVVVYYNAKRCGQTAVWGNPAPF